MAPLGQSTPECPARGTGTDERGNKRITEGSVQHKVRPQTAKAVCDPAPFVARPTTLMTSTSASRDAVRIVVCRTTGVPGHMRHSNAHFHS